MLPDLNTAAGPHVLHGLETVQGRQTRGKGRIGVQGLHIGLVGGTPDLPVRVLAVPDELLDHDVLQAVLLLGGGDNLLRGGAPSDSLGHGLSGSQAHDNLADSGVGHVGDLDGAVCHDACAAELVAD